MNDRNINSILLSSSILSSYIAFYTAYDKKRKKLDIELVKDFFLLRRGLDWSAVELNKAASLAGLTCILSSYITPYITNSSLFSVPLFFDSISISEETNNQVFNHGVSMCAIHSIYSLYVFVYHQRPINYVLNSRQSTYSNSIFYMFALIKMYFKGYQMFKKSQYF